MKPFGAQLIAEFIYCSKSILNDKEAIEKSLADGISKTGLNLISLHSHQFNPVGITAVAIIGESHVIIHTYPEARHASIDIFTCSNGSQAQMDLLHFLKGRFKPKTMRFMELQRGNPLDTKGKDWISSFSSYGFEVKYHIKRRYYSKRTKYQQIDIIENENFGRMMFLDNDLQIAERDASLYNTNLVSPLVGAKRRLRNVAILGGGDGGVLSELLKHGPEKVVLVDIDGEVIKAAEKHLQCVCKGAFRSSNVKIVVQDANEYLGGHRGFDAVVYDLTMHPASITRMDRTRFLDELFSKVAACLEKHAVVTLQCCSEFDTDTLALLRKILSKYFVNIQFRKAFIPSFCENWIFASARSRCQ